MAPRTVLATVKHAHTQDNTAPQYASVGRTRMGLGVLPSGTRWLLMAKNSLL